MVHKTVSYLAILSLLLTLLMSCNGDKDEIKSGSLVPARFELPFNNTTVQKGQSIQVDISIVTPSEVKSIKVFTKDSVIYEGPIKKNKKSFAVNTSSWSYGTNQLTLETTLNDGKTRRDNRILKILPDVFPKEYSAEVLKVFPHATTSYTQGLEFDGDQLYEGTGGTGATGKSMVAKVDLKSGRIQEKKMLDEKYFGEGITIMGDKLYQLTWQEHTCFVYDKNTLEELNKFTYTGEGWGLCNDGEQLIMSDGSERLYFRDPNTFGLKRSIEVYTNEGPVKGLNELEYIEGKIYANVYTRNQMVIIDPKTGVVTGRIDASIMALDYRKTGEVLNGIAYKKSTRQLFVTGKNWPNLLEIGLVKE
ncbi:glutaminyl-peptide cyclotransferase [Brumimicrobium glaciale]|jgi:glutamine cyclotransferase|uniref:Glutaminyl-peptide cyclotransferase n=1 Tax=Brumimicrobium glaciale TaxID=200475 RepID=A0A4Q4KR24_9FLAO|nr:glutaminyl-peptide cyclotransferase [Brumimicrobium glaciale]RYM35495.1 glutaminyl-peptide cyclotransferase [Brumimicrobium glaciale]